MICLDNTDTLEGGASVDAVVDYTVHGLVGNTFTVLADGQLSDTDPSVLYTAEAAISIVSIILVNTHSAAVTVNLYLDPANAGTPRRMIPKAVSLGIGYSLHFDGQRISIMDTTGGIAYSYIAHNHDGDTLQLDGVNSDGGAFPFTTSGLVTFSQNITFAGQLGFPAGAVPSADPNTLDDYEVGFWTPVGVLAVAGNSVNSNQVGVYRKVGNTVAVSGTFRLTKGTGTGVLTVTGFPFTAANISFNPPISLHVASVGAANETVQMNLGNNSKIGYIWQVPQGIGGNTQTDNTDLGAIADFEMQVTYQVEE